MHNWPFTLPAIAAFAMLGVLVGCSKNDSASTANADAD
jgi:hypothetical protein